MADLAYRAMMFAREVHAGQVRKYTGDIRTTDRATVQALHDLYSAGVRVNDISEILGIPPHTIRSYVANHGLDRDPSKFEDGVACLSHPSEVFLRMGWAPDYFVSDHGRIVGMTIARPGTLLTPSRNPESGYLSVKIVERDGVARHNYVHRAVLRAFRGEPMEPTMQGAHGDGNKSNNRLANLRWDTPSGNASDKEAHGTLRFGSNHPNAKINEAMAATIKRQLKEDNSQADIAVALGVSNACVANIAQGKTWAHVSEVAQ